MLEALRKYIEALAGYTEIPRERAEKLLGDLQRQGDMRVADLRKAAQQLADRSARNRTELTELIRKEIRRQVSALGLATKDDIAVLERRVKAAESGSSASKQPAKTRTSAKKAPAKPAKSAAAKKPAPRKPAAKKPAARTRTRAST